MKHKELLNQIEGYLKLGHYLQAFLVQSAYIESLIRVRQDFQLFVELGKTGYGSLKNKPYLQEINKDLQRISVQKIVSRLEKSGVFDKSKDEPKTLYLYFDKRNAVIHNLTLEMSGAQFEKELEAVCSIGKKITKFKALQTSATFVKHFEKKASSKKKKIT